MSDPIVTSGHGLLRFESFSSCCSTYIRTDFLPEVCDGQVIAKSNTKVDFYAPNARRAGARTR